MFTRTDELIKKYGLIHEISEIDGAIYYKICGFKECPTDTIVISYDPMYTSEQKLAAMVIYDNTLQEAKMFDNITLLNDWFDAVCIGDDRYVYADEKK